MIKYKKYLIFTSIGASAVSASSIFHFTERAPEEAKQYLKKKVY